MSDFPNPVPNLPHATPFLLVDRVLEVDDRHGVFLKLVTATDPCTAHDGTLPGAFVLEALAQAGGAFLGSKKSAEPGYLAGIDDFRLLGEVRVGDELRLEVELMRQFAAASLFRARALVGERLVAKGRFTLALPR